MVHPAFLAIGGIAIGGMLNQMIGKVVSDDKYWFDMWHNYIPLPEEYTDTIDELLTDPAHAYLGKTIIGPGGKRIAGLGTHLYYKYHSAERVYFSWNPAMLYNRFFYIILEKIKEEVDGKDFFYYRAITSPIPAIGEVSLYYFLERVLKSPNDQVRVVHIDTSSNQPKLIQINKICGSPNPNQVQATELIFENWTPTNNFNTKVMLCGKRGTGKSYTARIVKKILDKANPNVHSRLYYDFDPTAIGVDINTLVLRYASPNTPIILVINEIDIVYEKVLDNQPQYDPRTQHTRNIQTFHNMLDALGDVANVITIFTTEKSPEELKQNEKYKSFMRKGRVDFFVTMTENISTYIQNG